MCSITSIFDPNFTLSMNILCPTDFSSVAGYAFHAACLLAQQLDAELHLLHCSGLPEYWPKTGRQDTPFDPIQEAVMGTAHEQLKLLQAEVQDQKISCSIHLRSGRFIDNIEVLSDDISFEFVVMGSHGVSGKKEWFIGSNTQKVIRRLHNKVLVIKEPLEHLNMEKVVFASSLLPEDQIAFRKFLDFSKMLGIKEVHVLSIHADGLFAPPQIVMKEALKDFKAIADAYDCQTHYVNDISIEAGIRHFTEEHRMDLIAISNHVRHPLKRIFSGNTVEMVVNHAEVPVLSIDYV